MRQAVDDSGQSVAEWAGGIVVRAAKGGARSKPQQSAGALYGRVAEWQGSRLIIGGPGSPSKH